MARRIFRPFLKPFFTIYSIFSAARRGGDRDMISYISNKNTFLFSLKEGEGGHYAWIYSNKNVFFFSPIAVLKWKWLNIFLTKMCSFLVPYHRENDWTYLKQKYFPFISPLVAGKGRWLNTFRKNMFSIEYTLNKNMFFFSPVTAGKER